MSRRKAIVVSIFGFMLVFSGCRDLITIDFERCGNGLVESELGEVCDIAVDESRGEGLICGPPGVPSQACQYVCGSTAGQCPRGWVCDEDDVCIHPIGDFVEQLSVPIGSDATHVLSGDFDGDGARDLLWSTNQVAQVDYNDRLGGFTESFGAPLPHSFEPALADLNNDGRTDVTLGVNARPLVLIGQADRQLTPTGIPEAINEVVLSEEDVEGLSLFVDDQNFAAYLRVSGGVCVRARSTECENFVSLPEETAATAGVTPLASTATMSVVALTYAGSTNVLLVTEPGTAVTQIPVPRPLLGRAMIMDGALIVQIESDDPNHLDAVARVQKDANGEYEVIIDRGFEDFLCMPAFCALFPNCPDACVPGLPEQPFFGPKPVFPLEVWDYDGNGRSDLITPLGFVRQRDDGTFERSQGRFDRNDHYRSATAGDLNRDGVPDAVLVSTLANRIEVWTGRDGGQFSVTPLAQRTRPEEIFLGDFDLDLLDDDIAFIEPGDSNGDFLTVLYNTPPLFSAKRFSILGRTEAAISLAAYPPQVLITVAPEDPAPRGMVIFESTTSQLMLSTLYPPEGVVDADLVYVGTPRLDDIGVSIFGVWTTSDAALWTRPRNGLRYGREQLVFEGTECPRVGLIPCDGTEGSDEVINITISPLQEEPKNDSLIMITKICGVEAPQVITANQNAAGTSLNCEAQSVQPFGEESVLRVRSNDLDLNGTFEVIFLTESELRIIWNYADGGEESTYPFLAEDFVILNADDDPSPEILGLTPGRAQLFDLDHRSLVLKDEIELMQVQPGRRLRAVADDFTGDGLDDVIIASGFQYTLFRSVGSRDD